MNDKCTEKSDVGPLAAAQPLHALFFVTSLEGFVWNSEDEKCR